jgi:hypothetical protein
MIKEGGWFVSVAQVVKLACVQDLLCVDVFGEQSSLGVMYSKDFAEALIGGWAG